jgi:hypothetical protein
MNDKKNGVGVLYTGGGTKPKNIVYEGEWKDDLKHGQGVQFERQEENSTDIGWTYDGQVRSNYKTNTTVGK